MFAGNDVTAGAFFHKLRGRTLVAVDGKHSARDGFDGNAIINGLKAPYGPAHPAASASKPVPVTLS